MKILIDGDGCPVIDLTIKIGQAFQIETIIFCDTAHLIEREGAKTVLIQKGLDAVDFVIANKVEAGDVVVTQDYGLATMILAKKAYAINQNGLIYTPENIDELLFRRHVAKITREAGNKTKGPKKRSKEDNERFEKSLRRYMLL
ncbi:MAG: YaiI/YqxD family protein [Niameybacter sp.]|uniref:YaiI/YqxD family protein n=1 Tax=Niameybacter sp. TaxID=2033640 RepID=UPI002FCB5571